MSSQALANTWVRGKTFVRHYCENCAEQRLPALRLAPDIGVRTEGRDCDDGLQLPMRRALPDC